MAIPNTLFDNPQQGHWDTSTLHDALAAEGISANMKATERWLHKWEALPPALNPTEVNDADGLPLIAAVANHLEQVAKKKRLQNLVVQFQSVAEQWLVVVNDGRMARRWLFLPTEPTAESFLEALGTLAGGKPAMIWPHGAATRVVKQMELDAGSHVVQAPDGVALTLALPAYTEADVRHNTGSHAPHIASATLTHLDRLEAESIHIMREVAAQAENPVMLYSVGKDSSVMLHLARKAFYPAVPPFPLMHVDTRWKFKAMYAFRQYMADDSGMGLITHINPDGVAKDINPFDHGSAIHTDIMKTEGLKQALNEHGFDVAFGGARRDEEKSRAKERVFSFRNAAHRWDPKNQRPELWNVYNGQKAPGESIRVFPLSNWTELDIWQYIYRENIPIVPLYFAKDRAVVERDGMLLMIDDDRFRLLPEEEIQIKKVRFRTLGCYPLTGAVESDAETLPAIVLELLQSRTSERQGRAIDSDSAASMEKKKQEGYF